MQLTIQEEIVVDDKYIKAVKSFVPIMFSQRDIDICGRIGEIMDDTRELDKIVKKGKDSPSLRQTIHDKKRMVLFLLR